MSPSLPIAARIHGRGTAENPVSRFDSLDIELDEEIAHEGRRTHFYRDASRSIIARNNSPDVGFDFSINPYRGCEHGCIYCYARPTHEYFGMSAGLDFESRILVKDQAPELLRRELSSSRWKPSTIAMSGVTDPYQPVERRLELTRRCLQVLQDFGNPVSVITKNHLVARDADILGEMAAGSAARVHLSITSLDPSLQQVMEPRTSAPRLRLAAIEAMAERGVPVGVMVAPVIPGLTDHELPSILEAARDAGATTAGFIMLRLPHGVKDLFSDWLERHYPDRAGKVLGRIRDTRDGSLNDPRFRSRMRGEGEYAGQIKALFEATCQKLALNQKREPLSITGWRGSRGGTTRAQLNLF